MRKPYKILTILLGTAAAAFLVMLIVINPLPPDLTIVLAVTMMALLAAAALLFGSKKRWKRVAGIFMAALFVALLVPLSNFMVNTHLMLNRISGAGNTAVGPAAIKADVANEPFNIYITGIDQWAAEKGEDLERSDVNMIVTVNPKTKTVLLTSIPRDTYVRLHTAKQMDKLTHTGVYGVDETLNTVHDWLGVDLNYYVKMNFTGACAVVDAVDGIDVYTPVAFESSIGNYQYYKGWNHLYGREALYFARERHTFGGKDSKRVENQQIVVKALIKKLTSSTALLTHYGDIMKAAGENVQTNMSTDEMQDLVKMQIAELASWDIQTQKIEGVYDQDYVASLTQTMKFDVYRPYESSVRSCTDNIKAVMNPTKSEVLKANEKRSKSFFVNLFKKAFSKTDENENEKA